MSAVLEMVSKRAVVLNPQRCALAEQWRQDWVVNAEVGTTIDDILDPAYWAHMAAQFQRMDRIEVRMETGEWVADLICTESGRNWAAMHLITKHVLQPATEQAAGPAQHEVIWRGQQHRFCIKRTSDNEILQANIPSKPEALAWLQNYEQVIAKT